MRSAARVSPIRIEYCSRSTFKREEWSAVKDESLFDLMPKKRLSDIFEVEFRDIQTEEPLLCDLEKMARFKAESAYRSVRVPCIVEHAGLILSGFETHSYPGGLTQPMWDALGAEGFLASCAPLSKKVIARAVIGYCDGFGIKTFVGETRGELAEKPKGNREFYWDTVFCPDGNDGKTYAQIGSKDLLEKLKISQSMKALKNFLEYRLQNDPKLFPGS